MTETGESIKVTFISSVEIRNKMLLQKAQNGWLRATKYFGVEQKLEPSSSRFSDLDVYKEAEINHMPLLSSMYLKSFKCIATF